MRRLIIALALIGSLVAVALPVQSQGLVVVQNRVVGGPPLPAFSNVALVAALHSYNPVGYPAGLGVSGNLADGVFTSVAPYPVFWSDYIASADSPPYLLERWGDQNSSINDLIQSGAARPTLQITTPVVVSGAGTSAANGTYTYRQQTNGQAQYNLVGQTTSTTNSAIVWNGLAWILTSAGGTTLYDGNTGGSFPWQDTWETGTGSNPSPTVVAGTQVGEIQFNGSSSCLQSSGSVTLGTAATAYLRFKTTDLASTDILFEVGATPTATPFAISLRTVAGVLTCSVTDGTGLLFNTETFNVSASTWYIITVIVDTTQGTASNQVRLLVNNSTSGVSAPVSTNLASGNLADGVLNVGARNQASSFFAGSMTDLLLFTVAHDSTTATAWYTYINSVN